MERTINESIWRQFGASLDALENAIQLCPEDQWETSNNFWYWSYHCLFWLDRYLHMESTDYHPPGPFTLSEVDPAGGLPERVYTKDELLTFLESSRQKARKLLASMTPEYAQSSWPNKTNRPFTVLEILLYNMRHVQHHAAQLNAILRREIDDAPRWVSNAKLELR